MPNQPGIQLSVVIPAFNEASRLPGTLCHVAEYLSAQPYRSEILVVDDGSTDGTAQIVTRWQCGQVPVRLLSHPDQANHGKGAAIRRGMLEAHGRFRLFMDADNSTTVDQVCRFWQFFEGGCEIVIGSRNVEGAKVVVHQAWYKELAGKLGNWVIRLLVVPGISDTQAGFKMFTQESAETLFALLTIESWGYDIELLAIARCRNYQLREAPITWVNATGSRVSLKSYFQVLADIWRIRRNVRAGLYR